MHQTQIIGISGKQFAGKDVLADWLVEAFPEFKKIPLALAIKQAYSEKTGLSLEEIEANKPVHRPELIALGDWGRAQDPYYWLKKVLSLPGHKILSDVRLKREHELLRHADAFLIRLDADLDVRAARGTLVSETDMTECDLDDVTDWDAKLQNNSTVESFRAEVDTLLSKIP